MTETDEGLPIGTILLDRYRIEKKIGAGGMSHVYLAKDQWQNDSYAVIKTPIDKLLQDKWIIKKFKQEAESLARLSHPGIVRLLGHGSFENRYPFVIQEFVEGSTLKQIIPELVADLKRAGIIFLQIAEAVEHAHQQQIFHRDLKPENIMVQQTGDKDEQVKIIDFGIARIDNSFFSTGINTRYQVGTPYYLSPNRIGHDPDDRADDIYSLGLIAFELMTGKNPLSDARNFNELINLQEQMPPPRQFNPKLPRGINKEIVRALSLNQTNRHTSALEFGQNLYEAIFKAKTVNTDPTSPLPPPIKNPYLTEKTILLENYSELLNLEEDQLLSAISAGERFLLNGDFESAILFYDEKIAVLLDSDILYSRRAMALLMKKDYDLASNDCQQALRLNPKNDFAHLIRGIIYRLKLWTAEAVNELQNAIQINPNNLEASLILGDIFASRGETESALNYYAHICRVNPQFSWAYTNRGNLFYDRSEFEKAIEDFSSAINTNSELDWNFYRRAKAYSKIGKNQESLQDLSQAISLNPKNTSFYNERARLYFNLGLHKEALADFNRVKELSARDSFVANEQATLNKDKKSGLASLIDYLKWILTGQNNSL